MDACVHPDWCGSCVLLCYDCRQFKGLEGFNAKHGVQVPDAVQRFERGDRADLHLVIQLPTQAIMQNAFELMYTAFKELDNGDKLSWKRKGLLITILNL